MRTDLWDVLSGILDGAGVVLGLVSLACGAVALLIALWGLRSLIRRLRESVEVASSWPRAEAVITDVKVTSSLVDGTPQRHAVYEFRTPAGLMVSGEDEQPVVREPVVGAPIAIAYDPVRPTSNHPVARIRRRIGGWLVMFAIVELLLFGCAGLLVANGVNAFV